MTSDSALPRESALTQRWPLVQPWLSTVVRIGLAAVWLVAGGTKITDISTNVRSVNAYRLFPYGLSQVIGSAQPFLEIALGLLLLIGLGARVASIVSAILLVVFIAGIISAGVRGLRIDCGCFSSGGNLNASQNTEYTREVLRDIGFLVMSVFLVRWPRGRFALDGLLFPPIDEPA